MYFSATNLIQRQNHRHLIAAARQGLRQAARHIRQAARLTKGRALARYKQYLHIFLRPFPNAPLVSSLFLWLIAPAGSVCCPSPQDRSADADQTTLNLDIARG